MRKIQAIAALCLLLITCQPVILDYSSDVIDKVSQHNVAIATIYSMGEAEWQKRVANPFPGMVWKREDILAWQEVFPIQQKQVDQDGKPVRFLAYIGAGTIIKDNHVLSVAHLFTHGDNTFGHMTYAFKDGMDHPVECELVARGDLAANWINDYSVIRLKEPLGLPGLKISRALVKKGDKVIVSGSVGGLAYFTRFARITDLQWYFNVGGDGRLHLSTFGPVVFWIVYPGGPGDSGGSITNLYGEIIGVIAWGIDVHNENYCMINPQALLWGFLQHAGLEHLGG